ncbi:helix-turn-helix domain-containing GNAT family N-acetyltransferase [Paraburkholderia jirisanensis]
MPHGKNYLSLHVTDPAVLQRAETVRQFNRFYTKHIGALHEHLHRHRLSLTEARVLRELARGRLQTAAELSRNLGLDSGYLSRLLTKFERRDLLIRRPSEADARQSLLTLTAAGHALYDPLDAAALQEVSAVLEQLESGSQEQLVGAMRLIERLLERAAHPYPVTLRAPRAGDYGWLVQRQAQLFSLRHGWDHTFEGLLAKMVADFVQDHDPQREACWIAEQRGTVVGCTLLTALPANIAMMKMLYVEPDVQRLGIGTQLLNECVRFATRAGYAALAINTASAQLGARRMLDQAGFARTSTENAQRFGHALEMEHWERRL